MVVAMAYDCNHNNLDHFELKKTLWMLGPSNLAYLDYDRSYDRYVVIVLATAAYYDPRITPVTLNT